MKVRAPGALIFVGAIQFIISMIIAEALYPNYSVAENYISDLGVGPTALIFNTSVLVLGATILASSYLIHRAIRYRLFTVVLFLCGVGCAGVGIFPEDVAVIHGAFSFVAFLFGALAAIASYKIQKVPLSYFAVILGILSLVAMVLFSSRIYLSLGKGGMERMIAYPLLLWATGFGGYLMANPSLEKR